MGISKINNLPLDSSLSLTGNVPWPELGITDYATLSQALTTIGKVQTTLNIPAAYGAVSITANTTIPANIHLRIDKGAYFNIADGVTLTIKGTLEAGLYQIFTWSGTGKVVYGTLNDWFDAKVKHAYPEWWGAVCDGSTDDLAALNACRDALSGHATVNAGIGVMHLNGWYAISSTFSVNNLGVSNLGSNFTIHGIGKDICGFICNPGCDSKPIMEICGSGNVRCYDFSLAGISRNCLDAIPAVAPSVGLFMCRTETAPNGANARFKEFGILGFFRRGCIYNVGYSDSTFEQIFLQPSTMNDGQYMFHVCLANNNAVRPFTDIVPTNATISSTYGGAEACKFIRLQTGGEYTRSKGAGNACFYLVAQYPQVYNCTLGGNFDYTFYALNTSVHLEDTSGDGGGTLAGIYLCSNSNGGNYPNCNSSVYIVNYMNKTTGGGIPIIKTDAYTNLINSYCNKLRGNNTFTIDLGRGLKDSRILDTFGMRKFYVGTQSASSQFLNNEVDIPYDCQDIKINSYATAQPNKINDLRYTGTKYITWHGVGQHRLSLPGIDSTDTPSLYFGKPKIIFAGSIPTSGSWVKGDVIFNSAVAAGGLAGWSCVLSNTFGTLNSGNTTGNISIGTNILTVNNTTGLHIGDVIDVAGAITQGVVLNINYSDKTVTLDKNGFATVTGAGVSYHNELNTNAFKSWATISN